MSRRDWATLVLFVAAVTALALVVGRFDRADECRPLDSAACYR